MSAINIEQFGHNTGFDMSARYVAVNTQTIVERFAKSGFELQSASVAAIRNPAKQGFQKHLLKFAHPDMKAKQVGQIVPQILLKNSYDGSSAFELMLGVFRLVCSNGLVVGSTWESVRVRHVGRSALDKAIEGAFSVAKQTERLSESVAAMQAMQLTQGQQIQFAQSAANIYLPVSKVEYSLESILRPRRHEDTANDLWTIFNRVQENIVRGGVQYSTVNSLGRLRNATGRQVRSIQRNIELNRELWNLAEQTLGAV